MRQFVLASQPEMERLAKGFGEQFGYDGSDATHPVIQEWAELVAVYTTHYPDWHEVTEPSTQTEKRSEKPSVSSSTWQARTTQWLTNRDGSSPYTFTRTGRSWSRRDMYQTRPRIAGHRATGSKSSSERF